MMADWQFWLAAVVITGATAAVLLRVLRQTPGAVGQAEVTLDVYRDQLAEIDRDVARGVLAAEEAARLRTEVQRRLLSADSARSAAAMTAKPGALALVTGVVLAMAGATGGYLWLGAPGYPDVPLMTRIAEAEALRAARPDQATAVASVTLPAPRVPDAEFAALMERLRAAVASRPDDITGLALLARNEASLGNLDAALAAQQALIRAKATAVTAQDHADLAEMMIAAAGGYVSPEAEDVLTAALTLDPMNETARFYAGLMLGQVGRYDLGFRMWRPLADGLADQPWVAAFRARMPDMAARAGVDFTLTGPSAADIAAAADMTADDRAAMIAGMVTQLSDRLATEGGTAREWAQLIDALQVLGETDRAATILAEARTVFAGDAESLTIIDAAAAP